MADEIERKFLLDRLPAEVARVPAATLRQGYLALDGDTEVRVRLQDGSGVLTLKHGAGRTRTEVELELSDEQAEALWPVSEGRRIEKRRRRVPHDELVIEVDEYGGELEGLLVAEVEFPDERAAEAFEPPAWFGREVTGESAYKNQSLAGHGRPRGEDRWATS
jgi:CYTH domain-containing protein